MSDTTFVANVTPITATWLNDVNDAIVALPTTAGAASVGCVPTGNITANTVQGALAELGALEETDLTGQLSLGGAPDSESLRINVTPSQTTRIEITGGAGSGVPTISSTETMALAVPAFGSFQFKQNNVEILRVTGLGTPVNYLITNGAGTGQPVGLETNGTDSNVPLSFKTKGTGAIKFYNSGGNYQQFQVSAINFAVNYLDVIGSITAVSPSITATGTDTNIGIKLVPKGTGAVAVSGDVDITTVSKGIRIKEGTDATMGTAVLSAGSFLVPTTAVTANSRIFITGQLSGGTPGFYRVSARVAGTNFTITSSSGTDTSTVAWLIINPSA